MCVATRDCVTAALVFFCVLLGSGSVARADSLPGPPEEHPPAQPREVAELAKPAEPTSAAEPVVPAEPTEMIGAPSAELIGAPQLDGDAVPQAVGVQVDLEAAAVVEETPAPGRERSAGATASSQVAVLGLAVLGLGLVAGFLLLRRRR